ncbi:MAG: DUF1735 domain-containing protein [Bacteroidota bacterium]|jgi:hypothetical protein|nr:DUF1735 domain-containing protein [Bacteroidota bacterium]
MKKIIYIVLASLVVFACKEEITYTEGIYFGLSDTNVNFDSNAGEYVVYPVNLNGNITATVTSEGSEWCSVTINNEAIVIKVEENVLVTSRTAVIEVTGGSEKLNLMVRQARKYFTTIPAVKNLEAISGPNQVTLKWTNPEQDNFSHTILAYHKRGQDLKIILESGTTEYTVKELLNADGEYTFYLQSVDKDNDFGETVSVKATAGKLVAFRFENEAPTQWLPYYLRESDTFITTLRVGSEEYDEGVEITVELAVDEVLLDAYNQRNDTSIPLLPENSYTMPKGVTYTGTSNYQDYSIELNIPAIGDQKIYGLPVKIAATSSAQVSETMSSAVVIIYVDDLEGWYTVDRLPKNGESASRYPSDPQQRRRYIKRTGTTTWETGYLFHAYATSESRTGTESAANIQHISLDPSTKKITVQQGVYATTTQLNQFNLETNELYIEYLYRDWSGWWNHERMHSRSMKR